MTIYSLGDRHPEVEPSAWVAPDAAIIGSVYLGPRASVWFGAVLRGDTEAIVVGEGTNVQDNAVLHTDAGFPLAIGRDCTIGHKAILHGCRIGDETLIGMGATVLNGARIGRNCLIGAGALVTEGKEIPDGSLVMGMPAKVVRTLDAAAIEGLRASARGYQERAAHYRHDLKTSG
jgi:carbonic anhydrase/acetyltransferase-like protein (isoleucine patch superfamily)